MQKIFDNLILRYNLKTKNINNDKQMVFNLDLSKYGNRTEILISVIFSKIKTLLGEKGKLNIYEYIKSINNNNGLFMIKTGKPIINSELKMYEEEIHKIILDACFTFGLKYKEIKIFFK
ncbi:MAG: hypothetical protein PHS92_04260 [Candidatus Gracilibacteria bacterium]|nr:hypothetical protein [Candidatus Gracilibacteria bacterium]